MIKDNEFEPLKLLAVTERLRKWTDGYAIDGGTTQAIEDVKWLLDSHIRYYHENERLYHVSLYDQEFDISWRDRAEELERDARRYRWIAENTIGMKWTDSGIALAGLKPENEKYVSEGGLDAAIDKAIKEEIALDKGPQIT